MELSEKDEEYIISSIKQGKKVDAIVFVKDKTGMSLKEAKDYIDKKANNEYYEENISISKEDEEYICSLINENKKLQAVAFLHKEKEMDLKEAMDYIEREVLKNKITAKKPIHKRGYIFDEKLNILIPNLTRQKKALKIMKSIFWILLLIFLIQLIFLDRSSDIKMITFRFSISGILVLIITLPLGSLSIHYIENKLKKLKNLELSNQFEVKAFISNFEIFLHGLLLLIFIIVIPILFIKIDYKDYKGIFYLLGLITITIYGIYEFLKKLKNRKYSLNIDSKGITLLYDKNEIKSIKFEKINFIKFYAKKFKRRENNIPTIEIFDMEKNIFTELDIKISDYILLKMYFEKYKVLVKDEFKKI
ncbi:ABC transporter permease [Fusobacterium watanabei]|uniref:ABC transporter permease n=1 Tax=Fusobacterium watanabei TaxID=2686067 RepID=UPI003B586BC1